MSSVISSYFLYSQLLISFAMILRFLFCPFVSLCLLSLFSPLSWLFCLGLLCSSLMVLGYQCCTLLHFSFDYVMCAVLFSIYGNIFDSVLWDQHFIHTIFFTAYVTQVNLSYTSGSLVHVHCRLLFCVFHRLS